MVYLNNDFVIGADFHINKEVLLVGEPLIDDVLYDIFIYHTFL